MINKRNIAHSIFASYFIVFFVTLSACKSNSYDENYSKAFNTVFKKYNKIPKFVFYEEKNGKEYIFTYIEDEFVVLENFADIWINKFNKEYGEFELIEDKDIFISKDDVCIYFLIVSQGTQGGIAFFNIYSIMDNSIYTIETSGLNNEFNDILIPDKLSIERPDVLEYLEKKISESNYLIDELDDSPQNATVTWRRINHSLYNNLSQNSKEWFPIKTKKYNTKNIEDFFRESAFPDYVKNSKWEFENENYLIVSYFKGAVFAYSKVENKYFVIWVPKSIYDWIPKINFYDESIITLYDSDLVPLYQIDLQKMRIRKI